MAWRWKLHRGWPSYRPVIASNPANSAIRRSMGWNQSPLSPAGNRTAWRMRKCPCGPGTWCRGSDWRSLSHSCWAIQAPLRRACWGSSIAIWHFCTIVPPAIWRSTRLTSLAGARHDWTQWYWPWISTSLEFSSQYFGQRKSLHFHL